MASIKGNRLSGSLRLSVKQCIGLDQASGNFRVKSTIWQLYYVVAGGLGDRFSTRICGARARALPLAIWDYLQSLLSFPWHQLLVRLHYSPLPNRGSDGGTKFAWWTVVICLQGMNVERPESHQSPEQLDKDVDVDDRSMIESNINYIKN